MDFEHIYRLYFKDVFLYLRALSASADTAEEITQSRYADEELPENEPDIQPDFTERFADEESAFQIHRFLHGMDEPYKEVFSLRVFGELPFEKIGAIFGKSSGWARVTFYRAKKQIIEYMEVTEHENGKL